MYCLIKRQMEAIRDQSDEAAKSHYLIEVMKKLEEAKQDDTAPVVIAKINKLHQAYFGKAYSFDVLKKNYNQMMLQKEEDFRRSIMEADKPLYQALLLARVGNYIDFGAMGSVDDEKLEMLLSQVKEESLDEAIYRCFIQDIYEAKKLVYLTDNCGEIVLDKLLIEELLKMKPSLEVTTIVRGNPVLNDATLQDAEMVGLTRLVRVLPNGTQIAGTSLPHISEEARQAIEKADMIISKGQGNFETLHGCGKNIYYLFLCKCDWFVRRFHLERFKGVFVNETNHSIE